MTELQRRVLAYLYAMHGEANIFGILDAMCDEDNHVVHDTLAILVQMGLVHKQADFDDEVTYLLTPTGRALFDRLED